MDTLNSLAQGFSIALQWQNLLWGLAGVTLGTFIGVLPGLGPALTIALLLPITYSVDATAVFNRGNLPLHFVVNGLLHEAEGVEVFDLTPGA